MPDNKLVSIVIPAYNAAKFIRDALDSALSQSYPFIEVIVVDDGSEDDTADIVEEIARQDERVRLLRQENRGVAAARNLGIKASKGHFVAPLDADDTWSLDKLERQLGRFEAGGEDLGMVYSWWAGLDERGVATGISQSWDIEGSVYGVLLYVNFIGNASVPLFRREALEEVGLYDESFRSLDGEGCEDWDLSLRVAHRYPVGMVSGFHTGYREVFDSMSSNCSRMARSFELVWAKARQRGGIPRRLRRWSEGTFWLYLSSQAFQGGHLEECRRWLLKAAAADPVSAFGRWYWQLLYSTLRGSVPVRPLAKEGNKLHLGSIATPVNLEPYESRWWKVYAAVRDRRARWASEWSARWAEKHRVPTKPSSEVEA